MPAPTSQPKFLPRAQFFNVAGVPVSLGHCNLAQVPYCAAWDVFPPREFDRKSARRNGNPVPEAAFLDIVKSVAPVGAPR